MKPTCRPFYCTYCAALISLSLYSTSAAATYYVDATGGNDSKNGQSEANAWQTLSGPDGEGNITAGISLKNDVDQLFLRLRTTLQ